MRVTLDVSVVVLLVFVVVYYCSSICRSFHLVFLFLDAEPFVIVKGSPSVHVNVSLSAADCTSDVSWPRTRRIGVAAAA